MTLGREVSESEEEWEPEHRDLRMERNISKWTMTLNSISKNLIVIEEDSWMGGGEAQEIKGRSDVSKNSEGTLVFYSP